jgi:2'-hydroxyisoflavone reductase
MKLLFIGGTRFVGLAMAREAIARGHEVSIFHRSEKIPTGTESAIHLKGDRTKDFTNLQIGNWDAVIDVCGYRPHEIHALYDVFAGRISKYVFISTVSVYADDIAFGLDETANLADVAILEDKELITVPIDGETYGPLKVLCEAAVREHYQDNLIIRPTYVIGPDDYTNRFHSWVRKFLSDDVVEVPKNLDTTLQYIDVRDLANFTIDAIEKDLQGDFHVCENATKFSIAVEEIRTTTNSKSQLKQVDSEDDSQFPMWAPADTGVLAMNPAKAKAAGLTNRPLAQSIRDIVEEIS